MSQADINYINHRRKEISEEIKTQHRLPKSERSMSAKNLKLLRDKSRRLEIWVKQLKS